MKMITEHDIKQTALELFLEKGYNNVTVVDICNACGITKPTFYKHAGSKEKLVLDLYDTTVNDILNNPCHFIAADSHYEQLLLVFHQIIRETEKFGSGLFSQMLISNLNENQHSFDMRDQLTELCTLIIEKAQQKGEIRNTSTAAVLYNTIAHSFFGLETTWCIYNGEMNWTEQFFLGMNAILIVEDGLAELYKKYL